MCKIPATIFLSVLAASAALLCRCSHTSLAGGGTEDVNTRVTGMVFNPDRTPASHAQVLLIASDYDPVRNVHDTVLTDTTNEAGEYRFTVSGSGLYNAQIVDIAARTRAIVARIAVGGDTTPFPPVELSKPGAVKVMLPSNANTADGYIYIPGTTVFAYLQNSSGFVTLDSVPEDRAADIAYSTTNTSGSTMLRYGVRFKSGDTAVVLNPGWNYCRKCLLNTAFSGAAVAGSVMNFPVLIRLTADNFDFTQAKNNGEDIRFTKPGNTFLFYEIERWDPVAERAEVWVRMDTVYGNDSVQSLMMYWGNADAAAQSNGPAVFDTALGFAGVWHLGQMSGVVVQDATANANNGTATATTAIAGAVGMAQMFDGKSSLVRSSGPASDKLNFSENGTFSVSAWVKARALDSLFHGIVYKSNFQYGLQLKPENQWEFLNNIDRSRWEMSRSPAAAGSWHALTGVRSGTKQYLFVDGICVDSSIVIVAMNFARTYDQPLEIGHCPDGGADPDRFFNGIIDEVRISSVAISADWIKLCSMNQKEQDALVKW